MLNPPLNQLTAKINSKYLIATTAAKRARELDEKHETALIENYHSIYFWKIKINLIIF